MILGVHPYLILNGNGKEAVEFYKHALDAEVLALSTYGEFSADEEFKLPEEAKDLIVHANLKIGNTFLMISDNFPTEPYEQGSQVDVAVLLKDGNKAREVYEKLQQGGEVIMELQETPWSPTYGQVRDKFGVKWQISTYDM